MKKPVFLLFLIVYTHNSFAQENMGIANSNYAPANTLLLNPSSIVDSKSYLDINIIGASAFAQNNYVYLAKENFLFRKDIFNLGQVQPSYNTNRKTANGILDIGIQGPTATMAFGKHSFGIYTGARGYVNARKIPVAAAQLALDLDNAPAFNDDYTAKNVRVKSMSWAEAGLSYGTILKQFDKDMWTGGITVKRLFGIHNTSLIIEDADVEQLDSNSARLNTLKGKYAHVEPGWNTGSGWGVDLGVTYKRMLEDVTKYVPHSVLSHCAVPDYKYKIGVSLLDFGRIKYKKNAMYREFDRNSEIDTLNTIDDLTSSNADAGTDKTGNVFKAKLPTALSAQFDYNFENNIYVNATAVYAIPRPKNFGVERSNLLAVTPRYETRYFEASMPLSLYNFKTPHVGLAFRLYNVVIGTDNILPYFLRMNVYGADIYFNVKYTMFSSPKCKGKRNKSKKQFCPAPAF